MSRIGKKLIGIPAGVTVDVKGDRVHVSGAKGKLELAIASGIAVEVRDGNVAVTRGSDTSEARALHGLVRSLVANMIHGVANGYEKQLEIIGVGYKAQPKGKVLGLQLGFSHPVDFPLPDGIEVTQDEKNKSLITVKGIDKQLVGQVAANIRSYRPPEPYKGKGIRYSGEHVRRKPGKAAAAKTAA